MDYLGLILDTSLAVIGTIIAIIQLKNERRERRNAKKEQERIDSNRKVIAEVVSSAKQCEKTIGLLSEFSNEWVRIAGLDDATNKQDALQLVTERVKNLIEEYYKLLGEVTSIYTLLLINEENTSLSCGFERYIGVFREFLQTKMMLLELNERHGELIQYLNELKRKQDRLDNKSADYVAKISNIMKNRYIISIRDEVYKLLPYIEEIQIKYSNFA